MASANPTTNLTRTAWSWVARVDRVVIPFLRLVAVPMLRVSLGVVFVWFGLLKIFEVSPVSELVARTVYWVDPDHEPVTWTEAEMGRAIFYYEGAVNQRFLTVHS